MSSASTEEQEEVGLWFCSCPELEVGGEEDPPVLMFWIWVWIILSKFWATENIPFLLFEMSTKSYFQLRVLFFISKVKLSLLILFCFNLEIGYIILYFLLNFIISHPRNKIYIYNENSVAHSSFHITTVIQFCKM